jgi:hypothetical protein
MLETPVFALFIAATTPAGVSALTEIVVVVAELIAVTPSDRSSGGMAAA